MKYTYGFIAYGEPVDFGPIGIGGDGATVYSVATDEIAVVISDTSNDSIRSLPKDELVKHLAQHQVVVEAVMKAGHAIVPMKFGTVLEGETLLREMLQTNCGKLRALLSDIEGLFEIEVVAVWPDLQQVFEEIGAEKDVAELKSRIAKLPPGESMAKRLSLGKLVKDRLEAKKRAVSETLLPTWKRVAHRTLCHEIRHDAIVVNVAFLLEAEASEMLETLVRKADNEEGNTLNFRIVGPLPPYSFSTVQLRRSQITELDAARRELALPECITPDIVADAARLAMRRFHPDTNLADHELGQKFERVKTAVDLLKRFCPLQGLDLRESQSREFLLVELMEVS